MKKAITAILIVAFLALIYYCVSYMQAPVSTISAVAVTREEIIEADAFLVRKETVYTAKSGGTVYSYAGEGVRVGKDRKICAVYGGEVDENILQELGTINEKILNLSSVVSNDNSYTSAGGSQEQRLLQLYDKIEVAAAQNNVEEISKCKAEIDALLNGGAVSGNAEKIAALNSEKQTLEASITGPRQDIFATVSGIYSTKIDGYEGVLVPEIVEDITVEKFAEIKPEKAQENKEADDTLPIDIKVCKIIDNHEWYVMALVERKDIENIKKGDEVGVRFSKLPGEQTTATVASISAEPEGQEKAVLVLKCESFSEGAFSIRASSIEIVRKSYTGFEVPIHAIRVKDGQNGVLVRSGGGDVFKPCKMIYTDDKEGTAIIVADTEDVNTELRQYDMIIAGEK